MNKLLSLLFLLLSGSAFAQAPTFSPLSPPPANLTASPSNLASSGGSVSLSFDSYFSSLCMGKSGVTTGCPAVPPPWNGSNVCTGSTNAAGQTSCSYSAALTLPANPNTFACVYSFQAACSGTSIANSQIVTATVAASGSSPPPTSCDNSQTSQDLPAPFTRSCTGTGKNAAKGNIIWGPTFTSLFGADWPGPAIQSGKPLTVNLPANKFASFQFNTGSIAAGIHMESNPSYGLQGLVTVSALPGDIEHAVCKGSTVNISSKPGTLGNCKLQLNTTYYLNASMADYFAPHVTDCTAPSCTIAWTVYFYSN